MASVLRCHDLVRLVASFQDGQYLAVRSFLRLPRSCFADLDMPSDVEWGHHYARAVATDNDVAAWYATYGVHGLLRLVAANIRPCVHGIYYWIVACRCERLLQAIEVACPSGAPRGLLDVAAARGHETLVRRLQSHGHDTCSTNAMDLAAERGSLRVLMYLQRHRTEGATSVGFEAAVQQGHLDVVRFLYEHFPGLCRPNIYEIAAAYGQLDVLKYLCRYTAPFAVSIQRAKQTAAQTGHFDLLHALHKLYPRPEHLVPIARNALKRQHVALCDFFVRSLWPVRGSLEAYVGRGCVQSCIIEASRAGNLPILELIDVYEPRVPWPPEALERAAAAGHDHIARLISSRHPEAVTLSSTLNLRSDPRLAVLHGRTDVLKYLVEHPWAVRDGGWGPELLNLAAAHGRLDMVALLHTTRPDDGCTSAAMNLAAGFGHLDVVAYLNEHRTEGCTDDALWKAMGRRHYAMVQYLHAHCAGYFGSDAMAAAKTFLGASVHWDRKGSLGELVC
ncbi:hypothetical protein SPRG_13971 [Saprolegnia parasitica CBS 223.65]|uniref:Uncharacterized protein n=1 Tax=Saprolegnia parasitica (strain CBS 223.65) TaxID=695850 RepID=A0A067BTK1_SAPPC|nr:hypothetical protein SPRG_13971 [Saprolegnia parasitica CBS 223.65]KDO20145.1 hypothetical protein SPRG_13971 [Saprolegnia parasitica CBS 223.65]|eukprot:XP_012209139.1 hypothetical protein SPRG_13971 [Saprolegnia parasitica CBS 223.65]